MRKFNSLFTKTWWAPVVVLIIFIVPTFFRLLRPGFFPMYDDMQVIRLQQMDKCVKDLQIPCRWVPDLGYGYGYPLFEFYAPLPYYFMEIYHLLGFSFIGSVKIGFIFGVLISALAFYLLARQFFSVWASVASAILFAYIPIRAADLYVRGAMGEIWGMASLPLLIFAIERTSRRKDKISVALLALSVFIFLISHNLTVIMSVPLILLWLFFVPLRFSDNLKNIIKKLFTGFLIGILLASFFVIPLIVERNQVQLETLTYGYFNYLAHFATVKQIFLSLNWGYGPSIAGPGDDLNLSMGVIQLIFALISLFIIFVNKKIVKKEKFFYLGLAALMFSYLFLVHQKSTFIWQALPFMAYIQFPWRLLFPAALIASFLGGIFFNFIKEKYIGFLSFGAMLLLVLIYGNFFRPKSWFNISDQEKLSGESHENQITASIYDYLPRSAKYAPRVKAPSDIIFDTASGQVEGSQKGSDWFRYRLDITKEGKVVIPTFDFPGWKVWVDEDRVNYAKYGDLGLLAVNVQTGNHEVYARLTSSTSRKVGNELSVLGLISFGLLVVRKNKYV